MAVSAGPDNITPRVLKELAPFIAPILTVIFNISYESGTIPAIDEEDQQISQLCFNVFFSMSIKM
jgi:hypothetical protein